MKIIFRFDENPDRMCTLDFDTDNNLDKSSINALLALPSAGGADNRIFRTSPSTAISEFLELPGVTLTPKQTPRALSVGFKSIVHEVWRAPKMAVPKRTIVAPSSIATG